MTPTSPMRAWVVPLLVCAALAAAGCGRGGDGASETAQAQTAAGDSMQAVRVVAVHAGLDAAGLFTAFLEPRVDAPVIARADGIVQRVYVREGQPVRQGAALAQLENRAQQLDWKRAEALAVQAETEYARAEKAAEQNLISTQQLEIARAKAAAGRAEADRARLDLDRTTLRAPVAGVVRLARAEPHAVVREGEVLFRVADPHRLRASLYLPGGARAAFPAGAKVRLTSATDLARTASGRVTLANPVADPVTGLFRVEIEVAADHGFEAGQDVRVAPEGGEPPSRAAGSLAGAVLPADAYLERDGGTLYAFRMEGDRLQRVAVELGGPGPDGFTVIAGLRAGDLVLAAGETPPPAGIPVAARLTEGDGP